MNWIQLTSDDQVDQIAEQSVNRPQVVFKHSTRCSLSSVVWNRIGKKEFGNSADYYFLDIIANRALSNRIAADFAVHHESPQLLIIKNRDCVYEESHMAIHPDELAEQLEQ